MDCCLTSAGHGSGIYTVSGRKWNGLLGWVCLMRSWSKWKPFELVSGLEPSSLWCTIPPPMFSSIPFLPLNVFCDFFPPFMDGVRYCLGGGSIVTRLWSCDFGLYKYTLACRCFTNFCVVPSGCPMTTSWKKQRAVSVFFFFFWSLLQNCPPYIGQTTF